MDSGQWIDDPQLDGRKRYRDGAGLTASVAEPGGETYSEPYIGSLQTRFQHAIVVVGRFESWGDVASTMARMGADGWEFREIWDKTAAWNSMSGQTAFLFRRPVPHGVRLDPTEWCLTMKA